MPRLHKDLPATRRDWSFGDLVYWHLFIFGTRPSIDPSATAGREWDAGAICHLLDITDKTLRNWIWDRNQPDDTIAWANELFGDNAGWDIARLELNEALRKTRARKRKKGIIGGLVSLIQPADDREATGEASDAVGPSEGEEHEARGLTRRGGGPPSLTPSRRSLWSVPPFLKGRRAQDSDGDNSGHWSNWASFTSNPSGTRRRRARPALILVPGLALGIGTAIWAFRTPDTPKHKTAVVVTPPQKQKVDLPPPGNGGDDTGTGKGPTPLPPGVQGGDTGATGSKGGKKSAGEAGTEGNTKKIDPAKAEAARKAAEEKRIQQAAIAARMAAYEKKKRDEEDAARRRRCANGPFKVSGFKLLCDKLIAGGGSPGSNRERYVVPDINACAAYCREALHCSGFTYHASQPGKQHDCQILGRGFITNDGGGWVSGVRSAAP